MLQGAAAAGWHHQFRLVCGGAAPPPPPAAGGRLVCGAGAPPAAGATGGVLSGSIFLGWGLGAFDLCFLRTQPSITCKGAMSSGWKSREGRRQSMLAGKMRVSAFVCKE